ncbi:Aldo/keto reductase [Phellopilus nigrolimitatus]|nr:Aldo/keto reductase [Phellopilus nigrolimitatus]
MSTTLNKIPTRRLGENGPFVSAIGLGIMGISGVHYGKTDDAAAYKALSYAADRGVTFWDCADVYGTTELTLAKWFADTGRRSDIFLATKFGAHDPEGKHGDGRPISTPSYIKYALQRSLTRLGTDHIDLYYQHRVDPAVPIEVVLETLRAPLQTGVIRWLGLSECSAETLRRARAVPGVGARVVAAQMEFSPYFLDHESSGFVQAAKELGVSIVAYSPLARGLVSGCYRSRADFDAGDFRLKLPRFSEENFPKNLVLSDKLKAIADKYNATPSQVTLAWILAEHDSFVPIPGCRSVERVEENAGGAELKLAPEDVKAIRMLSEAADVQGARYPDQFMSAVKGDCIALEEWKGEQA